MTDSKIYFKKDIFAISSPVHCVQHLQKAFNFSGLWNLLNHTTKGYQGFMRRYHFSIDFKDFM